MSQFPAQTVLVIGGAGFIGSNFVHHLLAGTDTPRVVVLDKLTYAGRRANLAPVQGRSGFTFIRGDLADRATMDRVLADHRPGAIVNFAAESHVDRSIDGPASFLHSNVAGVFTLLEAVRAWRDRGDAGNGFRLLHVSTDEVYGDLAADDPPFTETTPYRPSSPYAATKAAGDHLLLAWARTYGLPVLLTNCSNNYGPYQFPEKLIPLMITRALSEQPLPIYGDGGQIRDWLHVADHCRALALVLAEGAVGETYLIGGRSEHTNLAIVRRLCAILDRLHPRAGGAPHDALIEPVADRPGHDRRYAIDPAKIERALGWRAAITLDDGLEQTVRWYLEHRAWWQAIRDETYQGGRLGLAEGGRS